jgi:hypothetical protein
LYFLHNKTFMRRGFTILALKPKVKAQKGGSFSYVYTATAVIFISVFKEKRPSANWRTASLHN